MKKALFVVLIAVFVLGFAATAFAATPTVIGTNGASAFTYKDLQDSAVKYQGGYAAFNQGLTQYADNGSAYGDASQAGQLDGFGPHGGYDTATNKCQVCHAVHRAEGAYYLLRADSQDDACDYCHVGGSAHSNKIVYSANTAGTATTNGHTMGASSAIPDSTDKMWTSPVVLSAVAADGVTTVSQTIQVRGYDTAENQMYRLEISAHSNTVGHPAESGDAYATAIAWDRVGPLALRCSNCHQVHDALAQVWHPTAYSAAMGTTYASTGADGTAANSQLLYGWNLLRRYPSATIVGYVAPPYANSATIATVPFKGGTVTVTSNSRGFANWPTSLLVKVPETTLTVGVNYSSVKSSESTYTENGVVSAQPTWVVSAGWSDTTPLTVNNLATSIWCADCHNLNVGGTQKLTYTELGFRSHAERTHPAPYAHGGACYSCHRDDLGSTVVNGITTSVSGTKVGSSCSQCHYTQSDFVTQYATSDFPHSGSNDSVKLLGNYSVNTPVWNATTGSYIATASIIGGAGQTTSNLDAVCLRCHVSTGVHN